MVETIRPLLMFQGDAEAAMTLYTALFPDGAIEHIERYGPDDPGTEGTIAMATISLAGQTLMCFDSPMTHDFSFTPAVSLFVTCSSDEEINRLSAGLSDAGSVLMPLADYGFSRKFVWLNDRFGVSWQLSLP